MVSNFNSNINYLDAIDNIDSFFEDVIKKDACPQLSKPNIFPTSGKLLEAFNYIRDIINILNESKSYLRETLIKDSIMARISKSIDISTIKKFLIILRKKMVQYF